MFCRAHIANGLILLQLPCHLTLCGSLISLRKCNLILVQILNAESILRLISNSYRLLNDGKIYDSFRNDNQFEVNLGLIVTWLLVRKSDVPFYE